MSYYDVVKSTYNKDFTVRTDSELIAGGYKNEDEACQRTREMILENELEDNEVYEVEQHNEDSGSLECIFSLN